MAGPLIPRSGEVVFVEGETDTWTLWFHYGPSGDVTWDEADPTYPVEAARRGG